MAKQLCQGVTIVHTVLLLWCWLLLLLLQCRPGGLSSLSSEDGPGREQAGACPFLQLAVICSVSVIGISIDGAGMRKG